MIGIVVGRKEIDDMSSECYALSQFLHGYKADIYTKEQMVEVTKKFIEEVRDIFGLID